VAAVVQGTRLPKSAHTSHPWRIHELARDFELVDVWALPTPGGPDDFPRLVRWVTSLDPERSSSFIVRTLFAARSKLGEMFGWDRPEAGLGTRVPSLRDRLPHDLRASARNPAFEAAPFTALYMTRDEFAAETANHTVHGVIHLGWVRDDAGGYRGQMAILVKRNGAVGDAYMALIMPFRYLLVYPAIMRDLAWEWRAC